MLAEYALIPDIFDSSCYSSSLVCDVHLRNLKEILLNEALVRDLRDGEWRSYVQKDIVHRNLLAKELLKKLIKQNRLRRSVAVLCKYPENNIEWCQEALYSHKKDPFAGIIAANSVWETFREEKFVASIENLHNTVWWQSRSPSSRLSRNTKAYKEILYRVLTQANSIMFIDPYIDPSRPNYSEFIQLLLAISPNRPVIEIHRVCYTGSGNDRIIYTKDDLYKMFSSLNERLKYEGLTATVFVWDDFHDRYLITDIIGVSIPYGFDISNNPNEITTWTRLGRNDKDSIQREFDLASGRHKCKHQFKVGKVSG